MELPDFTGYSRDWFVNDVITLKEAKVLFYGVQLS
jgi:hypothetical protein